MEATNEIHELQQITNVTELKSLVGLCTVFGRFLQSFARIAGPLNSKLEVISLFHSGILKETEIETLKPPET